MHEWRWQAAQTSTARNFARPLWLGDDTSAGKTILIHAEQGSGDFIQFCRYVPMVAARSGKVVLEVPPPLMSLAASLDATVALVEGGHALPEFDLYCRIMSLPLAFKTTLTTLPAPVPYLRPDGAKAAAWARRLGPAMRPRVGLAWSSGFRANALDAGPALRNVPLRQIARLGRLDIDFYSLQKGEPAETELATARDQVWPEPNLHIVAAELNDFSDTAALITNLDLVISVDTSVAHLAGALGKPVWILLNTNACWRWLLERCDSPWYPSAKLYRQDRSGDWDTAIERVRADLEAW